MDFEKDSNYKRLKDRLMSVGAIIPGTIRETYLQCGKEGCACAEKGGSPHGPYYFWNRKVKGKLTSKSITKERLIFYKEWIKNRQEFEALLKDLLDVGQKIAAAMDFEKEKIKSKKTTPSTRGK
jgi:hypothetical protein